MFIRSIIVVALFASCLAEENPANDAGSAKRAPMGFQGMRGKKDMTLSEQDDLSKRAPMGFQGMRGKKDISEVTGEDEILHEELEGRIPLQLQEMEMKKNFLVPDFEDTYYNDYYDKRAPVGLPSLRSKENFLEDEYYKRAPMGFQGMRGKKSLEEVLEDIEKRTIMGFQGMRGKKGYFADYPEDYKKRALAMGFHGMRGKKGEYPSEWEKRAPLGLQGMGGRQVSFDDLEELEKRTLMGFHGMRGKKNARDNEDYDTTGNGNYEQRLSTYEAGNTARKRKEMGFVGMRGKRDTRAYRTANDIDKTTMNDQGSSDLNELDSLVPYGFEKRSAFRYFGTRGKKNPRWEIRGKFVGVRGKKWAPFEDNGNRFLRVFHNTGRIINLDEDPTTSLDIQ